MTKFGIGVGRSTHTLVTVYQEDGMEPQVSEQYVPNDYSGAMEVVSVVSENGNPRQVVFTGNVRWGTPFAALLKEKSVEPHYYRFLAERGQRGKVGNVAKSLATILITGIQTRPYFQQKQEPRREEQLPHVCRLASEYLEATDQVRIAKHHLLDGMVILFPEAVKAGTTEKKGVELPVPNPQPPELFTKKMRPVLENPNPFALETMADAPDVIRELAARSLGRWVPSDFRRQVMENHRLNLANYDTQLARKEIQLETLRSMVAGDPLLREYGDGDIITVLSALIGWRQWPNWRELRRYCGLDVSRLDSTGKHRISRVRPPIRQYLYLFMSMTKQGREIAAQVKNTREDGTRRPHLRVKRLEKVLKTFWYTCLRG